MPSRYRTVLIKLFFCLSTYALSEETNFQSLTSCNCLVQNITYECTVSGGTFTVWSGSAFMCQGGEISLRHVGFLTAIGECNSGAVIARGIKTNSSRFTSQLTVRLSQELIGRSVTCSVEDGPNLIAVGSGNLTVSTNPFPPPSKIYIEFIGPNEITFSWNTVPTNVGCSSFYYNVSAVNCGTCSPNTTTSNSSICTNFNGTPLSTAIAADPCNFTIQSVICGNITGDMNYHLITLAVPDAPVVRSVPHYAFRTANLLRLATSFQIVESFNISTEQGIDGSATSYTIIYAETPSGKICNSAMIMASSFEAGMYDHTFEVSSSSCLASSRSTITTTVLATNILGNGSISNPIATSGTNTFVDVSFDPTTRTIQCSFLNQSTFADRKLCRANITYGTSCNQHLGVYTATGVGSSVTTPTIEFISEASLYCIFVSASNDLETVIVEGTLDLVNIGTMISNAGQQSTITAAVVSSVVVVVCIIAAMIIIIVILYQVYTRKFHMEVRIIKFTTSKTSSLADVLQVFKNHGVSILSINTHLHHTGINLETKKGFMDNYVFCICSERQKTELMSELKNIEFFEEHSSNQESNDTVLIKRTVKISVRSPGSILEILDVFNRKGIEILGVNTSTGDNSVVCKCSKQERKKILEDLKKLDTDSTDFSLDAGTPLRQLKSMPSTRRIEFLVRPEASDIARAIKVFGNCGVNITEINPDYIKEFDSAIPQPEILEAHNLVECVCKEGIRKELFAKLAENKAFNVHCLPDEDLPSRNNVNQDYCVVAFSVVHEVGSLANALKAFEDLDINILGINTLGCADHSTLQWHLNYKKCKVEFNLLTNERRKELIKEIQATGIVVEATSSLSEQAAAETCFLQFLIEDPGDKKSISIPKALQTVFAVFQEFEITITGYEMDRKSTCQRQYQHNHVEYSSTNAEEQHQVLIKELTATGIVKVLDDFLVDDDNKPLFQNSMISCM